MLRRLGTFALYVFCILVVTSVACRAEVKVAREFALPAIDGVAFWPRVSGDWAIALQNTNPNNIRSTKGIVCYDLSKRQVYPVYTGMGASHGISGNTLIWSGMIDNIPSLRGTAGRRGRWPSCMIVYDMTTGQYWAPVLKTNSAFVIAVSGRLAAYELGCRMHLFDLGTGMQQRISNGDPAHRNPDIGGDLVVWQEFNDNTFKQARIHAYRISTGQEFTLPNEFGDNYAPATDGKTIVWWTRSGVKVYDTKTGKERLIAGRSSPDVDDGIVVYLKSECACSGGVQKSVRLVYGMDLSTGKEFRIGKESADRPPSISGKRVVWAKGGTVYCAELSKTR